MKFELIHIDTCLPSYFGGQRTAYIQIPVFKDMTATNIRDALRYEFQTGCIGGDDRIAYLLNDGYDDDKEESEGALKAMTEAIEGMELEDENYYFTDLEPDNHLMVESVYAYFVIREVPESE